MDNFGGPNPAEILISRLIGSMRNIRTTLFVRQNGQSRVIEDAHDGTEIGPNGSIDTAVSREAFFHDCGHYANGNLGGRCECGALLCGACVVLCTSCGSPTCPKHRVNDPVDAKTYCRSCEEEIQRARRISKVLNAVASVFVEKRAE